MLRVVSFASLSTVTLLSVLVGVTPRRAAAQSATEIALAETLYRQARELSAAGNFAEACPKFAESYRLDPGTGTLLNLASCHESQGKFATAWFEYGEALVQARRDRRQSRIDFAEEHSRALEPKLSRLTLALEPGVDTQGLELSLDGAAIGLAALGAPTPVDPGSHTVQAKAPGKKPWSVSVEIAATAEQKTVTIPPLEAEPVAPPPPVVAPPPPVVITTPVTPPPPAQDQPPQRPVPASVYVAGGVTVALAVAAGVTGGMYLDQRATFNRTGRLAERGTAEDDQDALRTLGGVNLALWFGAAAGAGVTTYLYVTRPERETAVTTWRFSGSVAPGRAVLTASGAF